MRREGSRACHAAERLVSSACRRSGRDLSAGMPGAFRPRHGQLSGSCRRLSRGRGRGECHLSDTGRRRTIEDTTRYKPRPSLSCPSPARAKTVVDATAVIPSPAPWNVGQPNSLPYATRGCRRLAEYAGERWRNVRESRTSEPQRGMANADGQERTARKRALAERAGFEPAIRFPVYTLSRRAPSTTRPPLQPTSETSGRCGIGEPPVDGADRGLSPETPRMQQPRRAFRGTGRAAMARRAATV